MSNENATNPLNRFIVYPPGVIPPGGETPPSGIPNINPPSMPPSGCVISTTAMVIAGVSCLVCIVLIFIYPQFIIPIGIAALAALLLFGIIAALLAAFCSLDLCGFLSACVLVFFWGAWIGLIMSAVLTAGLGLLISVLLGFICAMFASVREGSKCVGEVNPLGGI
ncbi:hypothetical protein [Marinicella sp. W31]|uniref:hypothetical protein n=1 Tax=Marinicella sp. W31 TaxID=3023713 RepID=UPI00375817DD